MKIEKVIFSSDESDYLEFWKLNSEIFRKKFNVTPVLFLICDEDSDFYEDDYGLVKKIKKTPYHSTKSQSQIVRMWGTKFFPNDVCLINDIDMFLFNYDYLESNLIDKNFQDIVIFGSDVYDENRPECQGVYSGPNRYPMCYIVANGNTFNKILDTNLSYNDFINKVQDLGFDEHNDEIFFGISINQKKHGVTVHKLPRGYSSSFFIPNRIEKHMFLSNDNSPFKLNINGHIDLSSFIDCHCATPFNKYKDLIIKIKNTFLYD